MNLFKRVTPILIDQLSSYYHLSHPGKVETLLSEIHSIKGQSLVSNKVRILEEGTFIYYNMNKLNGNQVLINLDEPKLDVILYYHGEDALSHTVYVGDVLVFEQPECTLFRSHGNLRLAVLDYNFFDSQILAETEPEIEKDEEKNKIIISMVVRPSMI